MKFQQYMGLSGKIYELQQTPIAGGGEGNIYKIINYPNQVAKIFKEERRTSDREDKLKKMVKVQLSQEQLQQVMWPQDVIYTQDGFVGYIMPELTDSKNLNVVYATNEANLSFKHRILIAYNLCAAIATIHSFGQVCGDLNPQNICVNLNLQSTTAFRITLVDTDSYHFYDELDGSTYRCEVGLSDYIAPEIQNKLTGGLNLKSAPLPTYTKETDLFALAVHIFALLMNGSHPFACAQDKGGKITNQMEQMTATVHESVVLPQPIENIKDGFFPFHQKRTGITYPLYAPAFESLPEELQQLFIQTFEGGYVNPKSRVSAEEWMRALKHFATGNQLCRCPKDHWYSAHMKENCPWCAAGERYQQAIKEAMGTSFIPPENSSEQEEGKNSNIKVSNNMGNGGNTSGLGSAEKTIVNTLPPPENKFAEIWSVIQLLECSVLCVLAMYFEAREIDVFFENLITVRIFGDPSLGVLEYIVLMALAVISYIVIWRLDGDGLLQRLSGLWSFLWIVYMIEVTNMVWFIEGIMGVDVVGVVVIRMVLRISFLMTSGLVLGDKKNERKD